MSRIAIIPARGGSKRIPRKNIRDFLGKPIIAYTIQAALSSNLFDKVMVSTDDEEIALIAKKYGADVPFLRSSVSASDYATTEDVVKEVLHMLSEQHLEYNSLCCLQATAPLMTSSMLIDSYSHFKENNYDSLIAVAKFSYPIQRALVFTNNTLQMRQPEHIHTRSQDLEPMYHDSGMFYWMKTDCFISTSEFFCENAGKYELEAQYVQDIDTIEDWNIAELKYKIIHNHEL